MFSAFLSSTIVEIFYSENCWERSPYDYIDMCSSIDGQKEFAARNLLVLLSIWAYIRMCTYTHMHVHVRMAQFLLLIGLWVNLRAIYSLLVPYIAILLFTMSVRRVARVFVSFALILSVCDGYVLHSKAMNLIRLCHLRVEWQVS